MPDVHDTPKVSSGDRMHVMDRTCWCKPMVLKGPEGGDDLIVHNEIKWGDDPRDLVAEAEAGEASDYG
jgi:hypothetical protein